MRIVKYQKMANKFLVQLFLIFLTSFSADSYCNDVKEKLAIANIGLTGRYLYRHFFKYPAQSYTVASLPMFCILGDLACHTKGKSHARIMEFLDMKSTNEIKKILPEALWNLEHDTYNVVNATFIVYADDEEKFTHVFKKDFVEIANGESKLLDYNSPLKAVKKVNNWFARQSSYPATVIARPSMFQENNKGLFYGTSLDFMANFDHEYNPSGLVQADYHMNETVTYKAPALEGNGFARYAEVEWLDAKVLQFPLKGEDLWAVFFYPNDANNLLELLRKIQNPHVYFKALEEAKWMCVYMQVTVGQANVGNDMMELVPELHLNTTDLYDVFESNFAQVTNILQQLHLYADNKVRQGSINSKYCPGNNWPLVKMDHPCAYYVITTDGLPLYGGVLYGPTNYDN